MASALQLVPIDGQITLDSRVEGDPDTTLRDMIAAKDSWIEQAFSMIREAVAEKERLYTHLGVIK